MKRISSLLLALFLTVFSLITQSAAVCAATEITSPSAIVMEASTGQVIYEKKRD